MPARSQRDAVKLLPWMPAVAHLGRIAAGDPAEDQRQAVEAARGATSSELLREAATVKYAFEKRGTSNDTEARSDAEFSERSHFAERLAPSRTWPRASMRWNDGSLSRLAWRCMSMSRK